MVTPPRIKTTNLRFPIGCGRSCFFFFFFSSRCVRGSSVSYLVSIESNKKELNYFKSSVSFSEKNSIKMKNQNSRLVLNNFNGK